MKIFLEKTKFSNILQLRINIINFDSEKNIKYLETSKLNFIVDIQID